MSPEKEATVSITASQLKDLFKTVIEESRKPVVTDEQLKQIQQSQQDRREQSELLKQQDANHKLAQKYCTHSHGTSGKSAAVFVHLNKSGYMYCQHCQLSVFPDKDQETFNVMYAHWFQDNQN